MRIPLVDLPALLAPLGPALTEATAQVVLSGRYILGEQVRALEAELATYLEVGHAVGVSSGTDALLLALWAADVGPGDRVITTPYSFFSTAGVIPRLGAIPVFVDVEPHTLNLDPDAVERWLVQNPNLASSVKAIVAVHLFGLSADLDPLLRISNRYGIRLIEDAAQAIGATYPGQGRVGKAGALGCFSFFPTKNLGGAGDGGLVVTQDEQLAERVRRLRSYGLEGRLIHRELGGNFRLDELQAAILRVKLPHLEQWNRRRQHNALRYTENLGYLELQRPAEPWGPGAHVFHQYVIQVPERDALKAHLLRYEIESEVYYPIPLHLQPCFESLGYRPGDLPQAEAAARRCLALPVHPTVSDEQVDRVCRAIGDFLKSLQDR